MAFRRELAVGLTMAVLVSMVALAVMLPPASAVSANNITNEQAGAGEESESTPVANVTFLNQTTTGDQVTIADVTVPNGGFVAIYTENFFDEEGNVSKEPVGTSRYLGSGTHTNVTVPVNGTLNESQVLVAALFLDTDNDQELKTSEIREADSPYIVNSQTLADTATVELVEETKVHTSAPDDVSAVLSSMETNENGCYIITDDYGLQAIEANKSACYVLDADINMSGTSEWHNRSGFAPVGNASTPFRGNLDGQGHTIHGLSINRTNSTHVGLFGATGFAHVSNVTFDGHDVHGDDYVGVVAGEAQGRPTVTTIGFENIAANGTVVGESKITGGLVGEVSSTGFRNVTVAGHVEGSGHYGGRTGGVVGENYNGDIRYATVSATVTGDSGNIGSLAGRVNSATVSHSSATGYVGTTYWANRRVGGLVGWFNGIMNASYATGTVVGEDSAGGLVGYNGNEIRNSYSTANVTGSWAGGLVGYQASSYATVNKSYAAGNLSTDYAKGGIFGQIRGGQAHDVYWNEETAGTTDVSGQGNNPDGATNLTTSQMQGSAAETNMTAFDWTRIWDTVDNEYPALYWEANNH